MGEIINLRTVRKAKARKAAEQKADQNRVIFGEGRASKMKRAKEKARHEAVLDGGRLTPPIDPEK
jgi:primosomal protein N''